MIILFLIELYQELIIFQQSSYKASKYIKTLRKYYIYSVSAYFRLLLFSLGILCWVYNLFYIKLFTLFIIFGNLLMQERRVLKLKFTKRIFRLIFTSSILTITSCFVKIETLIILIYLIPIIIISSSFINFPLEKMISFYYCNKAKQNIEKRKCLKIGITGSFGKTSTKFYLSQVLSEKYYVHASPKSYNTLMGISKDINQNINEGTEIYILEMGATKLLDIKKINNIANINIGVITSIGTQHLESFKSIENIIKTKLEIIESNCINTVFINSDIQELNDYIYPQDLKVVKIGFNKNADYMISDIEESFNNLSFKINGKVIDAKLLGKHNVLNLAFCYAISKYLNFNEEEIIKILNDIEPMDHRLKLIKYKNYQVIDDSFNSNFIGFKNAIKSLSLSGTYNILITPGLVEQDAVLNEYYKELSIMIKSAVDEVYLINNKSIKLLLKYFDDIKFKKYIVVESFKDAINLINKKNIDIFYTILIENDLTDYYLNRG